MICMLKCRRVTL